MDNHKELNMAHGTISCGYNERHPGLRETLSLKHIYTSQYLRYARAELWQGYHFCYFSVRAAVADL